MNTRQSQPPNASHPLPPLPPVCTPTANKPKLWVYGTRLPGRCHISHATLWASNEDISQRLTWPAARGDWHFAWGPQEHCPGQHSLCPVEVRAPEVPDPTSRDLDPGRTPPSNHTPSVLLGARVPSTGPQQELSKVSVWSPEEKIEIFSPRGLSRAFLLTHSSQELRLHAHQPDPGHRLLFGLSGP